jgi:hypothetical protein
MQVFETATNNLNTKKFFVAGGVLFVTCDDLALRLYNTRVHTHTSSTLLCESSVMIVLNVHWASWSHRQERRYESWRATRDRFGAWYSLRVSASCSPHRATAPSVDGTSRYLLTFARLRA